MAETIIVYLPLFIGIIIMQITDSCRIEYMKVHVQVMTQCHVYFPIEV